MGGVGLGETLIVGLVETLMLLLPFAFIATIVGMVLRRRTDRLRLQADLKRDIIAKFGSAAELHEFLKSEEGKAILKPIDSRRERTVSERAILRIGLGIILVIVGSGLAVLAHYADQPQFLTPNSAPQGPLLEVPPGTGLPAAAILLAGIGLIVSSVFILLAHPRQEPSLRSGDPRS